MSEEEGTITPELQTRQLEERLAEETDRLEKLYVAYKKVEDELAEKNAIIEVLEKEARIHEVEIEGAKTGKRVEHLEPELEKMEELYTREKARLGRVFEVTEELDERNRVATAELAARDDWYVQHMQLFEQLNEAIHTRYTMIDRAIEAARDVLASQETFKERMEEALDAVKETVEDIVDGDDEGDTDESESDES